MDNNFNQNQGYAQNMNYDSNQNQGYAQNMNYDSNQNQGYVQNMNYDSNQNQGYVQNMNYNYNQNQGYAQNMNYDSNQNQGYVQNMNYNYNQNQGYAQNPNYNYSPSYSANKRSIVNAGMILGLISAILLVMGLVLPFIDFSHFHDQIDIQYNLMKVCENIGLISSMWNGIPYGIIIAIVMMVILSFVKIPQLRLIPCIVVVAMLALMLLDMGNVVEWINNILGKYPVEDMAMVEVSEVFKSMMAGVYCLAAGLITGLVSCFMKAEK